MGQTRPSDQAFSHVGEQDGLDQYAPESGTRLGIYLRKLREGYGYTLRKVEERALEMGEAIDNSQLSRFEKGKAVPSFDKLRALARVFNVPVQNFSDVLDLEEYREFRPEAQDYASLFRSGSEWLAQGEHGRAFVTFERAVEVAEATGSAEMVAEARSKLSTALRSLGKLYMTERELREILKQQAQLTPRTRMRTLLRLSYLYRELGDLFLASVLAKESLQLAEQSGDQLSQAGVWNSLGNIQHDENDLEQAYESYRQALSILSSLEGHREMYASVLTNLGGCEVSMGQTERGMATLRDAHTRACRGGFRRIAALSLTRMAEGFMKLADHTQARQRLNESDSLASRAGDCYTDILFSNAFQRWTMARDESNGTREKIAFGRLRHLRSMLQRRFPEVEAFDRHVARIRR